MSPGKGERILKPASSLARALFRPSTCTLVPLSGSSDPALACMLEELRVELTYHHEARLVIERGPVGVD